VPARETALDAARRLAATASETAAAAERERRLDGRLVAEMADARLFALCAPAAVGGLEANPAVLVEAVETLACGDAAPAWCVAVCATSGLLAGYLPEPAAQEVYGAPATIGAACLPPEGGLSRSTAVSGSVVAGRSRAAATTATG
jgi:alkylation response protein AidB-like acyl-CoA dehydrogenase